MSNKKSIVKQEIHNTALTTINNKPSTGRTSGLNLINVLFMKKTKNNTHNFDPCPIIGMVSIKKGAHYAMTKQIQYFRLDNAMLEHFELNKQATVLYSLFKIIAWASSKHMELTNDLQITDDNTVRDFNSELWQNFYDFFKSFQEISIISEVETVKQPNPELDVKKFNLN